MGTQSSARNGSQKAAIREENERIILEAAKDVFANYGYEGATTSRIARQAGIPKANLHYYFPTKKDLYRKVIDDIFNIWLEAADSFDDCEDPVEAITRYIDKKMDISRTNPKGSKVWANEILQRAPIIQDYLETTLKTWTNSRAEVIRRWIDEGKIVDVNPNYLLYMIWATTQHYADFGHQVKTLNDDRDLTDEQFTKAKTDITNIILRGIGAIK